MYVHVLLFYTVCSLSTSVWKYLYMYISFAWLRTVLAVKSINFHILYGKDVWQGTSLGELRNEFLQIFVETLWDKLLLCQKTFAIISLNKKIIWLKFLFINLLKAKKWIYLLLNKGPSNLFKKFDWKSRINFCKMFTKSNWEFLK